MSLDELKDELVTELNAGKPSLNPTRLILLWALLSYALVIALILISGPLRPGWFAQLVASPRFLAEFVLGLSISPVAIYFAVVLNRPEERHWQDRRLFVPFALIGATILLVVLSIGFPLFEISDVGYRPHCLSETVEFTVPPMVLWLILARGGYSIRPALSGLLLGLASASPPAVAMHIACKYDPLHMLLLHFVPVCVLSIILSLVCWAWRRRMY